MVGKCSGGAGLESSIGALGVGVESMDGGDKRVSILSSAAVVNVDVRVNVATSPKALRKAKHLRCGSSTATAGLSQFGSKSCTLDKRTVRCSKGKE